MTIGLSLKATFIVNVLNFGYNREILKNSHDEVLIYKKDFYTKREKKD